MLQATCRYPNKDWKRNIKKRSRWYFVVSGMERNSSCSGEYALSTEYSPKDMINRQSCSNHASDQNMPNCHWIMHACMQRIIEIARKGQMIFLTWALHETLQETQRKASASVILNSSGTGLRTLKPRFRPPAPGFVNWHLCSDRSLNCRGPALFEMLSVHVVTGELIYSNESRALRP